MAEVKVGKARKKKCVEAKAMADKIIVAGRTYQKVECSLTKASANSAAKKSRKEGSLARIKKNTAGKGYCLYTRTKTKKSK